MEEERRREKERKERLQGLTSLMPRFRPRQAEPKPPKKGEFIVAGVHGMHCEVAQCCTPIPGEPVIGYITRGQGVKVHRRDCKNIQNAETERLIEVVYVGASNETYPVQFLIVAAERTGLLADLTRVLAESHINITDIGIAKRDLRTGEAIIHLKTELSPTQQISAVMNRLKQVNNVFEVSRIANGR